MTLKPRLMSIAEDIKLTANVDTVYDIGTDHALLPIWLIINGYCNKVIASDIREGPLEKAAANILRYGVEDSVSLLCCDGFEVVPEVETDYYVIISGVGGRSLIEILENGAEKAQKAGTLVLGPMNNLPILRKWLNSNGYRIKYEKLAVDDRRIYNLMFCEFTGQDEGYSETEYIVGKRFADCPEEVFGAYMTKIVKRLKKAADGLQKARSEREKPL